MTMQQGTPYQAGPPLADSLREWVSSLFPEVPLRRRSVLELALARVPEGHQVITSPTGHVVMSESMDAVAGDSVNCWHGANPRELPSILRHGPRPNPGKFGIVGIWTSPHLHTAANYPMKLKGGEAVTRLGPCVRVLLKIEAPSSSVIRRIPGRKNAAGVPVNYQWPLRPDGVRIVAIHFWSLERHAVAESNFLAAMNILLERKQRALLRDADELTSLIPEDMRDQHDIDLERRTLAPARIVPRPARPTGSAGIALLKLRRQLKRQRQWLRRHRRRIAAMNLPQPPDVPGSESLPAASSSTDAPGA